MNAAFSAEARLIHAGTDRAPGRPAVPPLVPASIYVSEGEPRPSRGYGRESNPGWEALEEALGGLEDAEAVAFASGQAASTALMLALAEGRERIVLPADGYFGARVLAGKLRPHGAVPVHADLQDLAAVARELKAAPSVLWAETPTNPPATSFGGVESTWERRGRWPSETAPDGLIRLSVGVEPAADLITDIDQALDTLEVP